MTKLQAEDTAERQTHGQTEILKELDGSENPFKPSVAVQKLFILD